MNPVTKMKNRISLDLSLSTEPDARKNRFVDAMNDGGAGMLLQDLEFDDSGSVDTWKSDTTVHLSIYSCTTQDELTATEEESSNDGSDVEVILRKLEEALADDVSTETGMRESLSELVVPYEHHSTTLHKRPAPWDSSSSDGTNSGEHARTTPQTCEMRTDSPSDVYQRTYVAPKDSIDIQPFLPKRRGSDDVLSAASTIRDELGFDDVDDAAEGQYPGPRPAIDESSSSSLQSKLQAFLMSRLSEDITARLNTTEWNQVCSEVIHFSAFECEPSSRVKANGSICHDDWKDDGKGENEFENDNQSISAISELTGFTGIGSGCLNTDHKESIDIDCTLTRWRATGGPEPLRSLKARSWQEITKGSISAPRMPSRRSRSVIANCEPLSTENMLRSVSRTSSLPSALESLNRRRVSFDTVEIRHYEQILDLNPSTSSGPSVGLGWNYTENPSEKVSNAERKKDLNGRHTVSQIPRHVREQSLKDCGYSSKQIAKAVRMNLKAKSQRLQTIHNYKIDQLMENSSRKVRRLFFQS